MDEVIKRGLTFAIITAFLLASLWLLRFGYTSTHAVLSLEDGGCSWPVTIVFLGAVILVLLIVWGIMKKYSK